MKLLIRKHLAFNHQPKVSTIQSYDSLLKLLRNSSVNSPPKTFMTIISFFLPNSKALFLRTNVLPVSLPPQMNNPFASLIANSLWCGVRRTSTGLICFPHLVNNWLKLRGRSTADAAETYKSNISLNVFIIGELGAKCKGISKRVPCLAKNSLNLMGLLRSSEVSIRSLHSLHFNFGSVTLGICESDGESLAYEA